MFEKIVEIDYDSKESYKKNISVILEFYGRLTKIIPSPLILIKKEKDSIELLVEPDIVYECTLELTDTINRLGGMTMIEYLQGNFVDVSMFNKLIQKLATNVNFPKTRVIKSDKYVKGS